MKKSFYSTFLIFLFACTAKPINKIKWIAGNWHTTGAESGYHEIWTRNTDGTYSGNSYALQNGDTIYAEKMLIKNENGKVVLRAANNSKKQTAFNFKLTKATGYEAIFENPLNDFPDKIIYDKMNDSTLVVVVSGKNKGKDVSNKTTLTNKN